MTGVRITPRELAATAIACFAALQKHEEFASLLDLLTTHFGRAPSVLEIGCGNGGSSWAFSKLATSVIAVDLPNGPWGGSDIEKMVEYIKSTCDYTYIPGDSHDSFIIGKVKALVTPAKGVDFLFIDGDHSAEGVITDFQAYASFVRPGGLIAFHDICEHSAESGCEVKKVWDGLRTKYEHIEFVSDPTSWGGIGVIKVPLGEAVQEQ